MFKNKKILAIIPARSGSKRLVKKNILKLEGKPLIQWTFEAANKSKYIDEVMVTTDDEDVIKLAKKHKIKVPFIRPSHLSSDTSTKPEVIKHTLDYYNEKNIKFDYLIYLQPTSPFRDSKAIDESIEYLFCKKADSVISVCETEHPIQWCNTLPLSNSMEGFIDEKISSIRAQDLEKNYITNGAIFICDINKFLEEGCVFLKKNIYAFKMDRYDSLDIDNEIDFKFAQLVAEMKKVKDG